jgi:hypothetical protein
MVIAGHSAKVYPVNYFHKSYRLLSLAALFYVNGHIYTWKRVEILLSDTHSCLHIVTFWEFPASPFLLCFVLPI